MSDPAVTDDLHTQLMQPVINVALAIEAAANVLDEFPDDMDSLSILFAVIVRQRKAIGELEAFVQQRLLACGLSDEWLTVESVGSFRRRGGSKRKRWEGERLASLVAARVADMPADPETGEMVPPGVLCQRVAEELTACAGLDNQSHSWRATELKSRSINPNRFCEWESGQASVEFVPVES